MSASPEGPVLSTCLESSSYGAYCNELVPFAIVGVTIAFAILWLLLS